MPGFHEAELAKHPARRRIVLEIARRDDGKAETLETKGDDRPSGFGRYAAPPMGRGQPITQLSGVSAFFRR